MYVLIKLLLIIKFETDQQTKNYFFKLTILPTKFLYLIGSNKTRVVFNN